MQKLPQKPKGSAVQEVNTAAFDVDGTLIHSDNSAPELYQTPRYEVIQLFKAFEKLGFQMFIWSGGGTDYAARWAQKLGLSATIVVKGSFTPAIAIDDQPDARLGRVNIYV